MVNAISGAAALALTALIRRGLAERVAPQWRGQRFKANQSPEQGDLPAQTPADPALETMVFRRIQALQPKHPQFKEQLLRVVVEGALLQEFGGGLINAPKFQELVEQVVAELKNAPALAADIDAICARVPFNG